MEKKKLKVNENVRNLPNFKVMECITEDESKLLYILAKGETEWLK